MCKGYIEIQSRRAAAPRFYEELKQNIAHGAAEDHHLISCACGQGWHHQAAPAGLAIVAALETELAQSGFATSTIEAAESASSFTPSLPIPISSSSSAAAAPPCREDRIKEKNSCTMKNHKPQKSIFYTSLSPPSDTYNCLMSCSLCRESSNEEMLGACLSCKRPLAPHKDIYIYRGDRAFCSVECRYKHIVEDESLPCILQGNQQCVQASPATKKPPNVAIPILV